MNLRMQNKNKIYYVNKYTLNRKNIGTELIIFNSLFNLSNIFLTKY